MARYEMRSVGVFDREANKAITSADGLLWRDYERWLAVPGHVNIPDPEPPADPALSLAEVVSRKIAEVETEARHRRMRAAAPAAPHEMAFWSRKIEEATAVELDPAAAAPMLALEAAKRGVSTREIAERVLAHAREHWMIEATIAGCSGKHKDAIRKLAELGDVGLIQSYDFQSAWE